MTYAACLVAMLACSAAYNLAPPASLFRERLRRADRTAIFAMVASTCAVLLAQHLARDWSATAAAAVWAVAAGGAVVTVCFPRRFEAVELAACLVLGWGTATLLLLAPAAQPFDATAAWLLLAGGAVYTGGAGIHLWHALPYQNAIWHAFVIAGTALHYVAIARVVG